MFLNYCCVVFFTTTIWSLRMDENDKNEFLKDFKKADIDGKLDMWFFALDQAALWEQILANMSDTATAEQLEQMKAKAKGGA